MYKFILKFYPLSNEGINIILNYYLFYNTQKC